MNGRIAALAGRVPELTAEQLDRMDAVALAALYSSGVRLLTVKNNDTITLHAVDPMGRLVWLDSNMPKNNCFDNTNFISPIVGGAWVASSGTKVVYSSSRNITLELTAPGGGLSGCVMTRINAWLLAEL